jgi:hypothetical protein
LVEDEAMVRDPMLEVRMTMVFLKDTVRPCTREHRLREQTCW